MNQPKDGNYLFSTLVLPPSGFNRRGHSVSYRLVLCSLRVNLIRPEGVASILEKILNI
jgi:hypothetical protein